MSRTRLALLLGAVAVLAVLGTTALAVATYVDSEPDRPVQSRAERVIDPASGATLQVGSDRWQVRGAEARIRYGEARATAYAVYDAGYCEARPQGSFRALAGFTDQGFDAWLSGVAGGGAWTTGVDRERVRLADGTPATLTWTGLMGADGPCGATGAELAMLRAGKVRAVVLADSLDDGTLSHDQIRRILLTLRLPAGR